MSTQERKLSRRQFLGAATTVAAATVLAACAPKATESPTTAPTAAQAGETATLPTATREATAAPQVGVCQKDWNPTFPPFKKYDPMIQISTPYYAGIPFQPGDDIYHNPMRQRILDNLGIDYTVHWESPGGEPFQQKLMSDIAAGTLADIVTYMSGTLLADLINKGALADIRSIWDATASDLTKQKKQYPNHSMWVPLQRGEKLYGVGFTNGPTANVDNIGWIRKDLLDVVGMKMPETLDELTEVLRAFHGKGLTAFGISANQNLVSNLDPIFAAFGVMPGIWRDWSGSGELQYGSIQPGVKEALKLLRGWYEEGLIDPDYYTYGGGPARALWGEGKVGVFFSPWWEVSATVRPTWEQHPDWNWSPMPAPKGPNGQHGRLSPRNDFASVFRAGIEPEKVQAAIQHLNWQIDMHVNWLKYEQYGESRNGADFTEHYVWEWDENCELKPGPVALDMMFIYNANIGFSFPACCYPDYQIDIDQPMAEWFQQDQSKLNKAQRFLLANPTRKMEIEVYKMAYETAETALADEYLGNPTPRMINLLPDLQKLESEYFNAIVSGKKPLDAFDEFVKEWIAKGGNQVTEDVNAWYKEQRG
jgi:putative aldouronate transport system substrate-binding protein